MIKWFLNLFRKSKPEPAYYTTQTYKYVDGKFKLVSSSTTEITKEDEQV